MVKIDLRFHDIEDDLWMLSEALGMLQAGLPSLLDAESDRIQRELLGEEDPEVASSIRFYLRERIEEGATVRFLSGSALVAVWAIYESAVSSIARYIARERTLPLSLSEVRGDFLTRARRYFDAVLGIPLHPAATDWGRLARIASLRHAFAHANGRMTELDDGTRRSIERWATESQELEIYDGNLIVTLTYVQDSLGFVKGLVSELITRTKAVT